MTTRARTLGWALLLCGCALSAHPLDAQDDVERPVVRAIRTAGPLQIDGRLDEASWADAPIVSDFTQVDPEEGQPVSERTEARVLYDTEALYVGVRLYDRQPVRARLGRRDMNLSDSDWLGVVIDSYHDHRTGYSFDVNPAGVQRDATKSLGPNGQESDDLSWDPVWQAAVTTDDGGWTAEYRIPFSQLRFSDDDEPVWGIQIERVIGRRREYSVLSFTPKNERGGIPTYGHLEGLRDIEPGQRLEVAPYVLSRAEYVDPGNNPFRTDSEYFGSAGIDLLYRVSSDFTLNATLNPDFGQVEADPAIVNLSVYEARFEEKRPFFIEGSEIFDFTGNTSGGSLFYSRRIGRRPQVRVAGSGADIPDATTILGAAKLSGKTASGWSLGILEAVTSEESARYMEDDRPSTSVVEPLTNYFVGRARRDLRAGQSSFGMMATAVNRDLTADAVRAALHEEAYAGGVDFRHEFSNRSWALQGSFVGSRVTGAASAITATQRRGNHFFQRPDAEHLDYDETATSLTGYTTGLSLARRAGQHWRGNVAVAATSPGFEANDLGFQTRTDRRDMAAGLTYLETRPGSFWRSYSISANGRLEHNFDNQRILSFAFLSASFTHLDFWRLGVSAGVFGTAVDDRSTRGGPLMERPRRWQLGANFNSDGRGSVVFGLRGDLGEDAYDGWQRSVGGYVSLQSSPRWNVTLSPSFVQARRSAQYVGTVPDETATDTYGARYLFAPLEQTTVSVETRMELIFTPRLSFQLYAQPFISSADYERLMSLSRPESYEFDEWTGEEPEIDFNFRSLRGTAVLRWEWRPGSTLFLAWQQTRSDFGSGVGGFDFSRDTDALFSADPDDIFVLKINYWLTP